MSEAGNSLIRQNMLRIRRETDPEKARALSETVVAKFLRILETRMSSFTWSGRSFAMFRGLPGEMDLRSLESFLRSQGSRLYFPRVGDRDKRQLEFVESLQGGSWQKGPYGIEEPAGGAVLQSPTDLSVVFMPGVAFGMSGERIGMGAGYYDRWLATHPANPEQRPLRIALAFDHQIFEKLEQNAWDLSVDWVFTERREYRSPAALNWLGRLRG